MSALISKTPVSAKFALLSLWTKTSDILTRLERPKHLSDDRRLPRVCFVKSTAAREFYNRVTPCPLDELIFSSTMRTGPIGLFDDLQGDMVIVNTVSDTESRCFERREAINSGLREFRLRNQSQLAPLSCDVDAIDWGRYDLVVAFENSVPSRVALKYPRTCFATLIEDHRIPDYQRFRKRLPAGYAIFLNLRSGPSPHDFMRRPWEVDFSYGFRSSQTLSRLLPGIVKTNSIHAEDHESDENCSALERLTGLKVAKGHGSSVRSFCQQISSARFFVSMQPTRPLGGLAAIDSISAGTVALINRKRTWNSHFSDRTTHVENVTTAAELINYLQSDQSVYDAMLQKQSALLQYYCFRRPMCQIVTHIEACCNAWKT